MDFRPADYTNKVLLEEDEQRNKTKKAQEGPVHLYASQDLAAVFPNQWGEQERVGACTRATFYRAFNIPKSNPPDARTLRKFRKGDIFHQFEQDQHDRANILIAAEEECKIRLHNPRISLRPDEILMDPETGSIWIHEVKSTAGRYKGGKGTIYVTKGTRYAPKPEHVLQVALYLHAFRKLSDIVEAMEEYRKAVEGAADNWEALRRTARTTFIDRLATAKKLAKENDQPVAGGKITYFDRENDEWSDPPHDIQLGGDGSLCINREPQPFGLPDILEQARRSLQYIDTGKLPPRDYELKFSSKKLHTLLVRDQLNKGQTAELKKGTLELGNWNCSYCSYKAHCWS